MFLGVQQLGKCDVQETAVLPATGTSQRPPRKEGNVLRGGAKDSLQTLECEKSVVNAVNFTKINVRVTHRIFVEYSKEQLVDKILKNIREKHY